VILDHLVVLGGAVALLLRLKAASVPSITCCLFAITRKEISKIFFHFFDFIASDIFISPE
jgi:hypothetical protein